MKPLIRLTLKIRNLSDSETLHTIGVLDINTAGDSVCVLDRDEMGVPHIDSCETLGDADWLDAINEMTESVKALQSQSIATEIASRGATSALCNLRRVLHDR